MEAAHAGEPGKTAALVAEVEAHRAELAYDFRHHLHVPLSEIGDGIPWDEACDLVAELGRQPGTHYWSVRNGFTRPTDWVELSGMLTAQRVINLTRGKDDEPIRLPIPIPDPNDNSDVTPERRDELVAYARDTAPFSLDD